MSKQRSYETSMLKVSSMASTWTISPPIKRKSSRTGSQKRIGVDSDEIGPEIVNDEVGEAHLHDLPCLKWNRLRIKNNPAILAANNKKLGLDLPYRDHTSSTRLSKIPHETNADHQAPQVNRATGPQREATLQVLQQDQQQISRNNPAPIVPSVNVGGARPALGEVLLIHRPETDASKFSIFAQTSTTQGTKMVLIDLNRRPTFSLHL